MNLVANILVFLFGAIVGTSLDHLHVLGGVLGYPHVFFWGEASWVWPLFGGAALSLDLALAGDLSRRRPALAERLARPALCRGVRCGLRDQRRTATPTAPGAGDLRAGLAALRLAPRLAARGLLPPLRAGRHAHRGTALSHRRFPGTSRPGSWGSWPCRSGCPASTCGRAWPSAPSTSPSSTRFERRPSPCPLPTFAPRSPHTFARCRIRSPRPSRSSTAGPSARLSGIGPAAAGGRTPRPARTARSSSAAGSTSRRSTASCRRSWRATMPGTGHDLLRRRHLAGPAPAEPVRAPPAHANFRYLEKGDTGWFGGGADLTP